MREKFILFALGYKAYKCLLDLDDLDIRRISLVVIGKDKGVSNDYYNEIEKFCLDKHIPYKNRQDYSLNDEDGRICIAIGWRWVINTKKGNLIVFHDSILPAYRGFNPLVSALINGDDIIGASVIWATEQYDEGEIIFQDSTRISYPIKLREAIGLVAEIYSKLFSRLIKQDDVRSLECVKQDDSKATYSVWRDKEDYRIDWSKSAEEISRKIDAVGYPYSGATTIVNQEEYIIHDVTVVEEIVIVNRDIGKVIKKNDNKPIIICGVGLLQIDKMENKSTGKIEFPNKFRLRFK